MADTATPTRYLRYQEAAQYTRVSVATLRRAVDSGRLRAYRPSEGRVVFDKSELDQFVHGQTGPKSDL
jgi:excisionase family DNA binding protein